MTRSLLLLLLSLLIAGCDRPLIDCSDKLVRQSWAPDRARIAAVVERNCGATTDFTTLVAVLDAGDASGDDIVFVAKGSHKVELIWNSSTSLSIRCETCESKDVFKTADQSKGVTINFMPPVR